MSDERRPIKTVLWQGEGENRADLVDRVMTRELRGCPNQIIEVEELQTSSRAVYTVFHVAPRSVLSVNDVRRYNVLIYGALRAVDVLTDPDAVHLLQWLSVEAATELLAQPRSTPSTPLTSATLTKEQLSAFGQELIGRTLSADPRGGDPGPSRVVGFYLGHRCKGVWAILENGRSVYRPHPDSTDSADIDDSL